MAATRFLRLRDLLQRPAVWLRSGSESEAGPAVRTLSHSRPSACSAVSLVQQPHLALLHRFPFLNLPRSRLVLARLASSHSRPRPPPVWKRIAASVAGGNAPSMLALQILSITIFFAGLIVYSTSTRPNGWLGPTLCRVLFPDAEAAHSFGVGWLERAYSWRLHPRELRTWLPYAQGGKPWSHSPCRVWGDDHLAGAVGISAGLDKDGRVLDALFELGASVVEIGGVTPRPQPGNPLPRVWRIPSLHGLINRYGLNSIGADRVAAQMRDRLCRFARSRGLSEAEVLSGAAGVPPGSLRSGRLLMVQVAKNAATDPHDPAAVAADYSYATRTLAPYADVIVVNVSSPNTPGLRDLQAAAPLTLLLKAVVRDGTDAALAAGRTTPPRVLVKVSPDENTDAQIDGVVSAVRTSGVDGVIVGNTTKRRNGLVPPGRSLSPFEQSNLTEQGGYSGPALFPNTVSLVRRYRAALDQVPKNSAAPVGRRPERKVIFASGGICTGQDVIDVIRAGASMAMVYTALVYGGYGTISRIEDEMARAMFQRDFVALPDNGA